MLKCHFLGKKSSNLSIEKNRRFVKISGRFLTFWIVLGRYRIYRKSGPTKSTVLGPGPPPWEFIEIYRKNTIFHDFRAFNRAGKTVTKIGIYSKPPPKWSFYCDFIISRPIFTAIAQFITTTPLEVYADLCPFGANRLWKTQQFFCFLGLVCWTFTWFWLWFWLSLPNRECTFCPQKGAFQAQ
jgi:hypothetical protein